MGVAWLVSDWRAAPVYAEDARRAARALDDPFVSLGRELLVLSCELETSIDGANADDRKVGSLLDVARPRAQHAQ